MEANKTKYCIMCEVIDKRTKATMFVNFNGDLIPLCDRHYESFKKQHLSDILKDEQPSKQSNNERPV